MHLSKKNTIIVRGYSYILWLSLFLFSSGIWSQTKTIESKSPEEKFQYVRELAFSGDYATAQTLGKQILDSIPEYHDVSLLIARTYMWEHQFDSAKVYIDKVLTSDPENLEAKSAKLDLAYFSGNMNVVEKLGSDMIKEEPENIGIREKYALALLTNNHKTLAGNQADSILTRDSLNSVALDIKRQLKPKPKPYELTVGYSFDHFTKPYKRWWHLYTAGLRKPTSWGSLEGRVNMGHLSAEGITPEHNLEFQIEGESYVNLTPSMYAMLLYGYSPFEHFPEHKVSAEVWHKLPEAFIVSVGLNYYHWDGNNIYIGTASLEKYLNKYWFCLRGYAHFKDIGVTGSYYFTARRYFNDIDYFQVTLGMGTAPDEPYDIKTDLERLSAYSIRCLYNKQLNNRWRMRAGLGYANEEYFNNKYRNRYDGTLSFIYSFGK